MIIRIKFFFLMLAAFVGAIHALFSQEEPILVIDPQGHSAMVQDVMFTPDGRRLISVSDDKTIRLWDVKSSKLLKTLRGQIGNGPEGKLYAGALSPDGRTLAVGGYLSYNNDKTLGRIRLINIETGEQTGLLQGHSDKIDALAFSPDGGWLASGSADDTVRIWNVTIIPTSKRNADAAFVLEGHTNNVYGVAFSPDSSKVVSASFDHTLRLWKKNNQGRFGSSNFIEMRKHRGEVRCVSWSPDGKYIVSGGYDKKILLWNGSGNFIGEVDAVPEIVATISFSSNSRKVIVSGILGKITSVYAIPSGRKISSFTRHTNTVVASAFYRNDLIATAGGENYDIYIWDADTAKEKIHLVGKGKRVWSAAFGEKLRVYFGQSYYYTNDSNWGPLEKSFDFSKMSLDRETPLASRFTRTRPTYLDKTLKKIDMRELQISKGVTIENDRSKDGRIHCYTFTNDGKVVVGSDFSLKLYQNNSTFVREFVGHTGPVWAVSVSGNGRILASAGGDQTIKLWNITTGELLATLFVATNNEWICWTPQGYYAASSGGEKYIGWHVNRGIDKAAEYHPVSSLRQRFHKPELVKRAIQLLSFEKALAEKMGRGKVN